MATLITTLAFLISAAATAVNVAAYVATSSPVSLGAAVFCGLCAVFNLALAVGTSR